VGADRDLRTKRRAAQHPDRPGERCRAEPGAWVSIVSFVDLVEM
jgi:hypothetical protein